MKKDIHAQNHRPVIFHDNGSGEDFLIDSTINTEATGTFEGKEYPLVNVEITSASHPFYTGQEKVLDTTGRVEKFKERMAKAHTGTKKKKDVPAQEKA